MLIRSTRHHRGLLCEISLDLERPNALTPKVNECDMVRNMCRPWTAIMFYLFGGLLPAADTGWTLARTPHFEVYSHAGGREARQVLVWFERLRGFLEQQTGVNVDSRLPLRILVFGSKQEYAPFRPSPTADAYFGTSSGRDYIVLPSADVDRLAAHEYWHFVARAGALRLPLWLSEGLAEFYSTVQLESRGGRMGVAPPLHLSSLRHDYWIRLPALLSVTVDSHLLRERETAGVFYAESWALAHMLKLSPAYAARFNELMERITSGMPSQQAIEATYGRSAGAVATDLRDWFLKGRTAPVAPMTTPDQASIDLSEVPSSTAQALLTAIRSMADVPDQAEVRMPEPART